MKKMLSALIVVLLLVAPALAETKIAYVDLQKALNKSQAGADAKQEIQKLVKKYEQVFKQKQDSLLQKKADLEKQAVLLSAEVKAEKEHDYGQELKELKRFQADVKDELKQKDAALTKGILEDMARILNTIGKEGGYTIILEKTKSAVVFADSSVDLTDELIKAYNAGK